MGIMDSIKGIGGAIYRSTPIDNFANAATNLLPRVPGPVGNFFDYGQKTDAGYGAQELGFGVLQSALLAAGAYPGATAAAGAGANTGRQVLSGLRTAASPFSAKPGQFAGRLPRVQQLATSIAGPVGPIGATTYYAADKSGILDKVVSGVGNLFGGSDEKNAKAPQEQIIPFGTQAPGRGPLSAADFRRFEEAQKAGLPTTTAGPLGSTTRREIGIDPILPAGAPGSLSPAIPALRPPALAVPTSPAATGGLMPLTPEQIIALAQQERELQNQYDTLLNALSLQETQGRQAESATRGAARREAAGTGQDIATQLAIAGLDTSPAPAIAGRQITGGRQQAEEMSAIKTLTDLLAEIQSGRTSASTQLAMGKTNVARGRAQAQIGNTLAEQLRLYGLFGGQ